MGRTSIEQHRIDTRDSRPIKQAPRRLPLHLKEKAEVVVRKMLAKDVIEPSTSPCSSPVVLVRKKDGTTRFCVDYCKVNSVHQFARDHLRVESQQQKCLYDHRSHTNSYREGRRYGCTTHKKKGQSPKLETPWEGPWMVTKQVTDVVYCIQRNPKEKPKFVHHDRLKPFQEQNSYI